MARAEPTFEEAVGVSSHVEIAEGERIRRHVEVIATPIIRSARDCGDDRGADAIEYLLDELAALAEHDATVKPAYRSRAM
jgi:hypothetical protein